MWTAVDSVYLISTKRKTLLICVCIILISLLCHLLVRFDNLRLFSSHYKIFTTKPHH
jgi:hypothetical protein